MQIDKNEIQKNEQIKLIAQGVHEMSANYSKCIDSQVCEFLRDKGYEVEETKFGMRRLLKKLENEGKKLENEGKKLENEGKKVKIKTINQKLKTTSNGILEFTFELEIDFVEVKK